MVRAAATLLLAAACQAGTVSIQTTVATGRQVLVVFPVRPAMDGGDCDGDGARTVADFSCFISRFAAGEIYADADGQPTGPPLLNVADFTAFLRAFAAGPTLPLTVTSGSIWHQCCCWQYGTECELNGVPMWTLYTVTDDLQRNGLMDDPHRADLGPPAKLWMFSVAADPASGAIVFDYSFPGFYMRDDGAGRWIVTNFW